MRKAARIDDNQVSIVKQLRSIPGVTVHSTAALGKGFPDIICGYRGRSYQFEIKNPDVVPSKQRLTVDEEKWHGNWTGHIAIITTAEQALAHMGVIAL